VALPPGFTPRTTITVTRPDHRGPGGDSIAAATAVATFDAVYEASTSLVRDVNGRETPMGAIFYVDDEAGAALVRTRDLVAWTDRQGRAIGPREIRNVRPWANAAGEFHHATLELAP